MAELYDVLQHPWLLEKGAASDKPLENEIQLRLKNFQGVHNFQRQALKLIASYLAPEEVQGLRNQFLALDMDRNGKGLHGIGYTYICLYSNDEQTPKGEVGAGTVTVDELREAMTANGKLPTSELEQLLQGVDMNASGAIDYEEFLAATLHASKIASDEHLQRAFKEFDLDDSGTAKQWCTISSMLCCSSAG